MTKCDVASQIESCGRRRTLGKNKGSVNKVGTEVYNNVLLLA